MKNREQQETGGESDQEPTNPTSAAVRLDSAFSIFAHEAVNLLPPLAMATVIALSGLTVPSV